MASSGSSADMYIGLAMSHLGRAQEETELISQLLNQEKRGFERLEQGVLSVDNDLTHEDLETSQRKANDLEQKFVQASTFASEAGKVCVSALRDYREKFEDLFLTEQDEELREAERSGTSRNNVDLSAFDDGQELILLDDRSIDVIPDLSRFIKLQSLYFQWNRLTSINDTSTLTELYLYGNKIAEIRGLDELVNLEALDVSYNRLKRIQGLTNLAKLKRLYLEHNVIEKIEGLDAFVTLKILRMSDNRIKFEIISHLSKLRLISIEGNRIAKLENLETLVDLEDLCVGKQGIETSDGIQGLNNLKKIDAGKSSIASLGHLDHMQQLEYLRLND